MRELEEEQARAPSEKKRLMLKSWMESGESSVEEVQNVLCQSYRIEN